MVALEAEREQAVVAVARDYFEGYFDGDAARLGSALHPELAKRSFRQVDAELDALSVGYERADDRLHRGR